MLALAGVGSERLQRRATDAAFGRGDGADESRVVVGVGQQAQVGGDVLDLGLVEERLPTRKQIRNALVAQVLSPAPRAWKLPRYRMA